MSLKQRVLAMVLGVMILLALLLGFLWYEHRQSDLQEKIAMRSQTQGVAYNLIVQALHDKTYAFVDKIVHDPKVAELLLRRDREGLYRYVAPIFAQSGVDVAGFVGSDERDFLRLKEPSKYGDRLTDKRPMLANAVRLRTMTSGFDATIYGPHYMVAIPVFNYIGGGEEFLGVFQAGVSVDYLQRRLEELLGSKSAVLFHHKALKLLGLHLSGKEIGDYLLLRDNAPIFSRLPSTLVLDKKVQKIEVDGRLLLLFSEELKGYHGSSIGRIIYYEDITPMKEEFYREILMGLVAAILLIWFIYLVLDLSFSSLLQKLEKNSQFLRTVADSMEEGLAVFNEHWEVTFINRAGLRLIGYEEREVLGRPMLEHLFVPTPEEEMYGISIKNEIKDALRNGERYHERDGEIHRRDGELLSVSYTFSPILDTHGHAGILMLFYDNTSQKEAEEKIKQQAYVDTLTRLKNRNKFFIDLPLTNDPVVFLVNIDSFKEINDFYGETVGDFILVELASFLASLPGVGDSIYRMQADEYAILKPGPMKREEIASFATYLCDKVGNHRFVYRDYEVMLNITVGVADSSTRDAVVDIWDDLLLRADMALKVAKKRHHTYMIYDPSMQVKEEFENNLIWMSKLRSALQESRIICHYQPIVNLTTGKIEKFESLVRMIDDDGQIISPYAFLEVAKRSRLYPQLTQAVVNHAFTLFEKHRYHFSINLSVEDLFTPQIVEFIMEKMRRSPAAPRAIFEIVESEGIVNYEVVSDFITNIKRFGAQVAIDDFGSGYSNFDHLLRLKVDYIKLDGSLIRHIDTDDHSRIIVETILTFAQKLGIATVAEFVHNEAVLQKVKALGVTYGQGYHLGKPMSAQEVQG